LVSKDLFPTTSQYILTHSISQSTNFTVTQCDYMDITGNWYIGLYTTGDIQKFTIQVTSSSSSIPIQIMYDSFTVTRSIVNYSYQYYALPVSSAFVTSLNLLSVTVMENSQNWWYVVFFIVIIIHTKIKIW
jgi:hypothetical protein